MWHLKQPDLGQNRISGRTNTFFYAYLQELSNKVKISHSFNQCASCKVFEVFKSGNLGQVGQSGG